MKYIMEFVDTENLFPPVSSVIVDGFEIRRLQ